MKTEKQEALLLALQKGWLTANPETGKCYMTRRIARPTKIEKLKEPRQTGYLTRNGYLKSSISINYQRHNFFLHQLIWLSVHGHTPDGKELNHINGIKTDNRIENLELVTTGENRHHAFRLGLTSKKGSKHHFAKLSEDDIPKIRKLRQGGLLQREIASRFGVSRSSISTILSGKNWCHVKAGGA